MHQQHQQEEQWPPEPTGAAMRAQVRSCLQKVRYESLEDAAVAAERARVTYGAIQEGYWCEWCWGYHNRTRERRRF